MNGGSGGWWVLLMRLNGGHRRKGLRGLARALSLFQNVRHHHDSPRGMMMRLLLRRVRRLRLLGKLGSVLMRQRTGGDGLLSLRGYENRVRGKSGRGGIDGAIGVGAPRRRRGGRNAGT